MLLSLETRYQRYAIALDTFSTDFDDIEEILRWQFWFINEEIERTVGIDEQGSDEEVRRVAGVTPERRSRSLAAIRGGTNSSSMRGLRPWAIFSVGFGFGFPVVERQGYLGENFRTTTLRIERCRCLGLR